MKRILFLVILFSPLFCFSQTFWTEAFTNGCTSGCLATTYVGPNGAWTQTSTGVNNTESNKWFISCAENGNAAGQCGTGCGNDASLHVGADDGFVLDPGAAYDAGGFCPILFCVTTHMRVESPTINCTGQTTITLAFNYMEDGELTDDDATLWYYNGAVWAQLVNLAKTPFGVCAPQGRWTAYSVVLPVSANNNANVKIGFNWQNDDDGVGTDPSFAVDDITLSVVGGAPPSAAFTASSTNFCVGTCINYTDNSTGTPTGWAWTFAGGTPGTSILQNPTNICYNTAGTYTATLVATNGNGSSTTSQTITVNALPTPSVLPSPASVCIGSGVSLTASGGTTYVWSPATGLSATTGATVTATPTATQTYTVTVTNAANCTATTTVTVTVNALPTAGAGSPVTICNGGNTGLSGSGGTSYSWAPGGSLSCVTCQNPTATPTVTTTYTVYVTNAAGCTATATVVVTVQPCVGPIAGITASTTSICPNGCITFTDASTNAPTSWAWTFPSGTPPTSTAQNPGSVCWTTPGNYTVSLTVTNVNGSSTTTQVITVNTPPTANAGVDDTICTGSNTTLNATGGTTYAWAPATGLSATTGSSPVANPTATTSYTVTVTDINGCTGTDIIVVTVNPLPTANAGPDVTICNGANTTLNGTGGTSFAWSPGAGLSCTTCQSPVANPTATTNYTLTVTNANGCTGTDIMTITVISCSTPNAQITASATTACVGDCINFSDNSTNNPSSWLWTFNGGTPNVSILQNPGTVCWGTAGIYTVTLIATNINGADTTTIVITITNGPTANAGNDTTISIGNSANLNGTGGGTYLWSPSTGLSCTTCPNPVANPTVTTTYTLIVTDANGCTDVSTITVTIVSEFEWFVPSGFSPNGDGENDVLFVRGVGIKSMQLIVYDRIGEKIFETTVITEGWDGMYKGKPMNNGIFVYHATVEFYNGNSDSKKGDVTLVR